VFSNPCHPQEQPGQLVRADTGGKVEATALFKRRHKLPATLGLTDLIKDDVVGQSVSFD
jgi:hypothetical protein